MDMEMLKNTMVTRMKLEWRQAREVEVGVRK